MRLSIRPSLLALLAATFALLLLAPALSAEEQSPAAAPSVTGILGAMREEVRLIEENLVEKGAEDVCGVRFATGRLKGRQVVVASSGIGKVNAAMAATLLVSRFRPREVLFSGIAGGIGPDVRPGDIVIAARTHQHDYGDLTEKGFEPQRDRDPAGGEALLRVWRADARLLALAQAAAGNVRLDKIVTSEGERTPTVRTGVVVTGDVFVASAAKKEELRRVFQADAVEMEGAAVAQVCQRLRTPCLIIRSISDSADAGANVDLKKFMKIASANSAMLVIELTKSLSAPPVAAAAPGR